MDLDKIKNTWQSTEIKPSLTEENIQQILSMKGQSAFRKLRFYDQIEFKGMIALIAFSAIFIILENIIDLKSPFKYFWIFHNISCILFLAWIIYKGSFLKRVNLLEMDVITISKAVSKYKSLTKAEFCFAPIWVVACAILCILPLGKSLPLLSKIIVISAMIIVPLVCAFVVYLFTTKKQLDTLQQEIDEIEDLENKQL